MPQQPDQLTAPDDRQPSRRADELDSGLAAVEVEIEKLVELCQSPDVPDQARDALEITRLAVDRARRRLSLRSQGVGPQTPEAELTPRQRTIKQAVRDHPLQPAHRAYLQKYAARRARKQQRAIHAAIRAVLPATSSHGRQSHGGKTVAQKSRRLSPSSSSDDPGGGDPEHAVARKGSFALHFRAVTA